MNDKRLELADAVRALADARDALQAVNAQVLEAEAAFRAEHAEMYEKREDAKADVAKFEERVRNAARALYGETGDKSVGFGVKIAVTRKLTVDAAEAIKAAAERGLTNVLKLDQRAYKKLREAVPDLPGELREEQTVRIPRDLAPAREEAVKVLEIHAEQMAAASDALLAQEAEEAWGWDEYGDH